MFSFESLQEYRGSFKEVSRDRLNEASLKSIDHAEVVESKYGLSVCFFMKTGLKKYIPLSRDSKLELYDEVDPSKGTVITLDRTGEEHEKYRWLED